LLRLKKVRIKRGDPRCLTGELGIKVAGVLGIFLLSWIKRRKKERKKEMEDVSDSKGYQKEDGRKKGEKTKRRRRRKREGFKPSQACSRWELSSPSPQSSQLP